MKHWKLILALFISFALGIAVSREFLWYRKVYNTFLTTENRLKLSPKAIFLTKSAVKAKAAEEHHEEEKELELSKKSQELIALKTIHAELATFKKKISVVGQIAQDVETSVHVVSPVIGEIAEIKAQIGSPVEKDAILCTVSKANGEPSVHEVRSPITGTVIGVFAKQKDRVDTISSIYTIADLTNLWATLEVYERDIADIKLGQKVVVGAIAYPKQAFEGKIIFISPRVDEDAHTIKTRVLIQNPANSLKLGMFVNADIIMESDAKYIILPQEAVHTISAKKVVFIKTADEKFEAREITVKDETKDEVAVAQGISEGEEVVAQDGFLLKSELLKSKMGEGCAE